MSQNFLCVDPGENIGLAMFSQESNEPIYTSLIKAPFQLKVWNQKLQVVLMKLEHEIEIFPAPCFLTYVEKPIFMRSAKGQVAADTGSFQKLCEIYGAICQVFRAKGYSVKEVPVNDWKGQWSKNHIQVRIERILGKEFGNHVNDAVGIGLYLKGLLK